MSDTKHTPTPWRYHLRFEKDGRNGSIYWLKAKGHAYAVAMQPQYVSNPEWMKDAAFIVRACNAHDELVMALQMAIPALEWCEKQWANSPQQGDGVNVMHVVRAALAKAGAA